MVVDARGGSFFPQLTEAMANLRRDGVDLQVLFLEASEESLVRRFESSRRPHPLQEGNRILDGLRRERLVLGDLRSTADLVIDTTHLNVHELRRAIDAAFAEPDERLRVTIMSFGFKHGIPVDADMVADARFLPNPFWDESLRDLTGRDAAVADAVLAGDGSRCISGTSGCPRSNHEETAIWWKESDSSLWLWGARAASIAAALTEALSTMLASPHAVVGVEHRDLGKE